MTYCNEKQMPCEWAQIDGSCSVSACRKVLLTPGGWPTPTKQPEFVKPPMTNADRIRAMSDEELAELLTTGKGNFDCFECHATPHECEANCKEGCIVWLQQPAEEDGHE